MGERSAGTYRTPLRENALEISLQGVRRCSGLRLTAYAIIDATSGVRQPQEAEQRRREISLYMRVLKPTAGEGTAGRGKVTRRVGLCWG